MRSSFLSLLATLAVLSGFLTPTKAQAANDSLLVLPVTISVGQATVSIPVSLTNSVLISGISGRMVFDGNLIAPQPIDPSGGVFIERVGRGMALSGANASTPRTGVVTFVLVTAFSPLETINPGSGAVCRLNFNVLTTQDTATCIRLEDDSSDPFAIKNQLADYRGLLVIPSLKPGSLSVGTGSQTGGCLAAEPIDDLGDMNLNGVRNEIADYVLFANFFIFGEGALSSDPFQRNAQTANSDVNRDGLTLRLADLVFLGRVITGDTIPLPNPSMLSFLDTVQFQIVQQDGQLVLSYASSKDMGGFFLRLSFLGGAGEAVRLDGFPNLDFAGQTSPGGVRSFLIPSIFQTPGGKIPAGSGNLLSIPFNGSLREVEIQASTPEGQEMAATGSFPISHRGDMNDDGLLTSSDVILALNCVFSLTQNCPLGRADLNCDGQLTSADAVLVINAAFLGEPPPCL